MTSLTVPPRGVFTTFMNFPLATDLDRLEAHVAIIGMPYGDPYSIDEVTNDQTNAPTAVRRASARISQGLDRWDFDIGGTVFDGKPIKVVDVGDVPGEARDLSGHYRRAEAAMRKILAAGALPVTIGGDHGVPIPVFRALDGQGPVTLIHLDASEMSHIHDIFQLGIRGQGSARAEEVEAARRYGAHIITSDEVHRVGVEAILKRVANNGRYYISIDADGLDPAVMPAVAGPQPGGLTYQQTIDIIKGLFRKGRVLGLDLVELTPARDVNEISSITAGSSPSASIEM